MFPHRGSLPDYGCAAVAARSSTNDLRLMPNLKPMANQRKVPRRRILKSGTIILGKKAHLPCSVRNLSEAGAYLEVQATFEIPSTFLFGMPGRSPRTCKVIWRNDRQLGVHFR
jgi:PilZ domain